MKRLARWSAVAGAVVLGLAIARRGRRSPAASAVPGQRGPVMVRPPHFTIGQRLWARAAELVDRSSGWQSLPPLIGDLVLGGVRVRLRQENLHDTWRLPSSGVGSPAPRDNRYLTSRTADGTFNDLSMPLMGAVNTRFGRNLPLADTVLERERAILTPNPRLVSRELLTREAFIPAPTLNVLAAAWLQFMVHDWLSHGQNDSQNPWTIPLTDDDPFPTRPMRIMRTRRDPTRPAGSEGQPPSFVNIATHWWDASQLYGSDLETQQKVRSGKDGKLTVSPQGLLPVDQDGIEITGVSGNWWIGLELLHTLFTLEHNAICDRLRAEYPSWPDEELFDRARLINAALLAKIHTVEWTTAILGHPTLQIGMRANWWGLAGERINHLFGRLSKSELISGIPGSDTDHFGVPYSITEEFVAVYRMHPLLPDEFRFHSAEDDALVDERNFPDLAFRNARPALEKISMANALYSLGIANPGALTLHNFPKFMQQLVELDNTVNDLAAIDLMRIRERGVPRYNAFRQRLHKAPVKSFQELCANPAWAEQIRRVYEGNIDRVDLMVGLFAETPPPGFGFSDTAFRIFILMASRRLNSDRFFTTDFRPEVYTPAGMAWIADNGFGSVLRRHFPMLRPALRGVRNPFAPWSRVSGAMRPLPARTEFEAVPEVSSGAVAPRSPKPRSRSRSASP